MAFGDGARCTGVHFWGIEMLESSFTCGLHSSDGTWWHVSLSHTVAWCTSREFIDMNKPFMLPWILLWDVQSSKINKRFDDLTV